MQTDDSPGLDNLRVTFSLPPATSSVADSQLTSTTAKPLTTQPSQLSCSKKEFFRAMLALTTLKRTSNFTPQQLKAWYCVLKRFPARVVNLSVVELATSETRFPEAADLFRKCQSKMPRGYCPNRGDDDMGKPTPSVVESIARDLGLDV